MTTQTIPAVERSVTVQATLEKAFTVFTAGFATWWPASHHIGQADLGEAVLEPVAGGRWYEKGVDGSECDWGRVLVFEPPSRLVLSWHINSAWGYDPDEAHASEVEVRFTEEAPGRTRVDLTHRRLERHVGDTADMRTGIASEQGGWTMILNRFADAANDA